MTPAPRRGRGRPAIGDRVSVILPRDLLADLDAEAAARGTTRAEEIRRRCDILRSASTVTASSADVDLVEDGDEGRGA